MSTEPVHCPSLQDGCASQDVCRAEGACHYTGTSLDPTERRRREAAPSVNPRDIGARIVLPPVESQLDPISHSDLVPGLGERITAAASTISRETASEQRVKAVMDAILDLTFTELRDYADDIHARIQGTTTGSYAVAGALTESARRKLDRLACAPVSAKPTE